MRQPLTFPLSISPKVDAIDQLEFDRTYKDVVVKHFSPYATGTHPLEDDSKYTYLML